MSNPYDNQNNKNHEDAYLNTTKSSEETVDEKVGYGAYPVNKNNDTKTETDNSNATMDKPYTSQYTYNTSSQTTSTAGQSQPGYGYGQQPVAGNAYGQVNSQTPQSAYGGTASSYTWNKDGLQAGSPYYPQAQKKPEKKKRPGGKRTGLKVVAALMCCLIISFSSVGAFAFMIQSGVINIENGDSENAAFTINKVVQADNTDLSKISSTISELTPQQVAEKLIPSVVCIQTYVTQNIQSGYLFGGNGLQQEQDTSEVDPYSEGSGIVYTKDGYIITNAHVIAGAENIKVIMSDGVTYEAELIGSDTMTDLAVIKVNPETDLTPAEFGSSEDLKVADEVMAIGNPGGIQLNSSVTMGYVSALDREVSSEENGYSLNCIQTDAAINPGNSGGALVNMYGLVVGINSSKIAAVGYEGLGFAIPAESALPIISDLMNYGYVKDRAMLGISAQYIDSMTARFYGLESGMYVGSVSTAEAQQSGLKQGDVITEIDGNAVTSSSTIKTYLVGKKPGDTVSLAVSRAETGETLTVSLVLSESTGD